MATRTFTRNSQRMKVELKLLAHKNVHKSYKTLKSNFHNVVISATNSAKNVQPPSYFS